MTETSDSSQKPRLSLLELWRRLRPDSPRALYGRVLAALGLLSLESGANVATPWIFSRMVGALSPKEALLSIPLWLIAQYAVLMTLSGIAAPLRDMLLAPIRADLRRRVVLLGLEQIHRMSVRFHLDRQTGALTRVLDRGADAVGTLMDLALSNVLPNVIGLILTFLVVFRVFDGVYLLLLVLTVGLYAAVSFFFTRLRMQARRARNKASNEAHHHLVDSILNFETVRHFGNERYELARHETVRTRLMTAEIRLQRFVGLSQVSRNVLIALTTTLLLGLAAHDIVLGTIGVAQFVLIGTYLRSVYASVGVLNYVSAGWRNARVDLEHFLELLALKSEIGEAPSPVRLPTDRETAGGADIVFDNVSFGYHPGRPVLKGITLHIPAGKSLAVVGRTGSGKSTLARLLTRAYDPTQGCLRIDGEDLRAIASDNLRALIGIVPQDTALFNETIGHNIAYGAVGAPPHSVEEAARRAQIDAFIRRLPEGYDTPVGERGLKLSGGEKQRVAIARIILRDPRILLLDEATSALDTRTEAAIRDELTALSRSRTTLMVAHRLSTVQDADHIVVLDEGRIIEEGTHLSLLDRGGAYAQMWAAQSGEEKDQA